MQCTQVELEQIYCKSNKMSFHQNEVVLKIAYKLCLKIVNEDNLQNKISKGVKTYVSAPKLVCMLSTRDGKCYQTEEVSEERNVIFVHLD